MHALSHLPALSTHDRLGVSLFASVLVHMVLVLMVAFVLPPITPIKAMPNLEITLVQTASDHKPLKANLLAQVNQDGGGDSNRPDVARNPLPVREIGDRQMPLFHSMPQAPTRSTREVLDILTQPTADMKIRARNARPDKKDARETPLQLGLLTPQELRSESARLNAEIDREWQEFQQRPRRKYLNARTQEYKYAAYMEGWRAKVVVLALVIRSDGSIKETTVTRSSGAKVLDDAAIRIAQLAAPFSAFPPEIRGEVDELLITRTWSFNEIFNTGD